MTGADSANEQVAQRLATRGRDALVERLRVAYAQAAEVHADVLSIDGDRLETIVQGAADRADGLQWRRALADVASGELGISLTDALAQPAVARAQELVGAPSYEDSLAALSRRSAAQPPRETSRNGGESQGQPNADARGEEDARSEEEPPWQSIADPEALAHEHEDEHGHAPEDEHEAAPETEDGDAPESGPGDPATAESGDAPAPAADATHEPEPPVAGPSAPPDLEPATIVQAPPEPSGGGAARDEPDRKPLDDPHATREWGPHEVAEAVEGRGDTVTAPVHSGPPPPTHVVPAPLPPETTAGGHVASHEQETVVSERRAAPLWERDDSGDQDDLGLEDDEQPDGPHVWQDEQDRLRVSAIHLGGVANLPRENIELRLSAHGLDIMRGHDEILGRLLWSEIDALEVPSSRVRRRRNRDRGRLVVRTSGGDASFEVPGFSSDELHERIAPLLARFGRN